MPALEQLQKELTDLKALVSKAIRPDGSLILPEMDAQQRVAFQQEVADAAKQGPVKEAILTLLPTGNGATTAPVGPISPVVSAPVTPPAGSVELLPASMTGGFTLKGFEKKEHSITLVKGVVYQASITVEKADGGGVYAQFVNPDGSGFGSPGKLKKGLNTFPITSPVDGPRFFSVYANGGNVSVSAASLTPSK